MRHITIIALFAITALTGCQTAEEPPVWEYRCVETNREVGAEHPAGFSGYLEKEFNELGADHWEMVGYGMNNGANVRMVCFKREQEPSEGAE